ncbi:MAG TPA: hypothetical protein VN428_22920 [Bryobacteraceae bacterium]|nr:hypothetical protein [Bryobacteraceae bacterium]
MTEKAQRKKSQKRQRSEQVKTPLTKEEFNQVAARAAAAGLSKAAFSRLKMLDETGERSLRRLPVDAEQVRKVLALHGKYGSNMNQTAYELHALGERGLEQDFRQALGEWGEIRDALLALLGMKPAPKPSPAG